MIHPLANVSTKKIGNNTSIWQYAVILEKAEIGSNCNISCHTFIENDVIIGDNVTIKSGVYLWDGIVIENDVFVGPSVVFTNDLYPRSKKNFDLKKTLICRGASIGANTSIVAGVSIGQYAMIGIGSVITKNVPSHALYFGSPATQRGWVDRKGNKMIKSQDERWFSQTGEIYLETEWGLNKID